jgi:peptidoglycan/LPS O-acetylase OafA/YrhL
MYSAYSEFHQSEIFNGNFVTGYWWQFSLDGVFGVQFFFIISGFVLGIILQKIYSQHEKAD